MERRELFSSFSSSFSSQKKEKEKRNIRPPYFNNDLDFIENCHTCLEKSCQSSCDENIIIIKEDGTPILNFDNSGCTYCDDCASACQNDVLDIKNKKNINAKFSIGLLECMSWNQTMCFSCKDPCLDDAIKFLGMFRPEINNDLCTNCGFCISKCPINAIVLEISNN